MSKLKAGLAAKPAKPVKAWGLVGTSGRLIFSHDMTPALYPTKRDASASCYRNTLTGAWIQRPVRVTITVDEVAK